MPLNLAPVQLQPADRYVYSGEYWRWLDREVLMARIDRPRAVRIPRHLELGLNGTHRITSRRESWWHERSPWIDVAFVVLVVAALIAGIVFAGGKLELGA